MKQPITLARHLGTTEHLSPLLRKARGLGLHLPQDLEKLAILRGCRWYAPGEQIADDIAAARVGKERFSNEELAIALLSLCLVKSQRRLRLAGAMLAAEGNRVAEIVRLARMERCEPLVRYIAEFGRRTESRNPFWSALLEALPVGRCRWRLEVLPHISRFVAMTGVTRRGPGRVVQWVRPSRQPAA